MSQTKLRSAEYSINEIVKKSSYQSHASRHDMKHILIKCVKDLHELGFKVAHVKGFKAKHVFKLVEHWKAQEKSPGTIKNCLSKLRELGRILGDEKLVKKENTPYEVEARIYKSETNRGIYQLDLSKCTDPYIKLSLEGQRLFGLRREESLKIVIKEAVREGHLKLKPSWTKGGIGRNIPIRTEEQKEWIRKVQSLVTPGKSLIPDSDSYKKHLNRYVNQTTRLMGLKNLHGLRHAYAQNRYRELTAYFSPNGNGWDCPFLGGKNKNQMNDAERSIDMKVKHILSRELGHSRTNVTEVYLG